MLRPLPGGSWLEPADVVRRLQAAFAIVEVSRDGVAAWTESVARTWADAGQVDRADRLKAAAPSGVAVVLSDARPEEALLLMVVRGVPIMAGFRDERRLESIQPLLRRCAAVLGYELR